VKESNFSFDENLNKKQNWYVVKKGKKYKVKYKIRYPWTL